jgi:hypothetical protein
VCVCAHARARACASCGVVAAAPCTIGGPVAHSSARVGGSSRISARSAASLRAACVVCVCVPALVARPCTNLTPAAHAACAPSWLLRATPRRSAVVAFRHGKAQQAVLCLYSRHGCGAVVWRMVVVVVVLLLLLRLEQRVLPPRHFARQAPTTQCVVLRAARAEFARPWRRRLRQRRQVALSRPRRAPSLTSCCGGLCVHMCACVAGPVACPGVRCAAPAQVESTRAGVMRSTWQCAWYAFA